MEARKWYFMATHTAWALDGIEGKIVDTLNDVISSNQWMTEELERVGAVVGKEGKTQYRAKLARRKEPEARWRPPSRP